MHFDVAMFQCQYTQEHTLVLVKNVNPWHTPKTELPYVRVKSHEWACQASLMVHWEILRRRAGRHHRVLWQVNFNSMQCGNGPQRTGLSDQGDIDEWAWQWRGRGAYVKVSSENHSWLSSPRKSESHTWKELWARGEGWVCVENKLERLSKATSQKIQDPGFDSLDLGKLIQRDKGN